MKACVSSGWQREYFSAEVHCAELYYSLKTGCMKKAMFILAFAIGALCALGHLIIFAITTGARDLTSVRERL